MRNWLTFNGVSTKDFGVYISGLNTFNAPERDVETISIKGKNGDLTIDNGRYKNLPLSYPAFIFDKFDSNIEGLRNFLLSQRGYKRLEDSYHPNEYRMARYKGDVTVNPVDWLAAGEFELNFDCYPQRFLKEGEHPITYEQSSSIYNAYQPSKPLIRAYGIGYFVIGDCIVTINTADEYTDIDCELQECYKDTMATNCNNNVTLVDFPTIENGVNSIILNGITRLDIIPRWWIL